MYDLKYIFGPFYIQHIERLLQASDAPSRKQAAQALAECLVRIPDWRGRDTRERLIRGLNALSDPQARAALSDALVAFLETRKGLPDEWPEEDPYHDGPPEPDEQGAAAVQALKALRSSRVVLALIEALPGQHWNVVEEVMNTLGELGDKRAVEFLSQRLHSSDRRAAFALGQLNAVEVLLDALASPRADVRRFAAAALGQYGGSGAVEPLIACLKDPDPFVRRTAQEALGELKDRRAVESLVACLGTADAWTRQKVPEALGKLGGRKTVEALLTCLQDPDPFVRKEAVAALGKLGELRAIAPIQGCLQDSDKQVRQVAAQVLKHLVDRQENEIGLWLAGLTSPSAIDRRNVARKLAQYQHDPRVIGAWLACLEDKDPVELESRYTSGELDDEADNRDVLWAVADELWLLGPHLALVEPRAFDRLLAIVQERKVPASACAAYVLGALQDARAVDPLIGVLQEGITEIAQKATIALRHLRDYQVLEKLIQALQKALREQHHAGVGALVYALGELEDDRAIEPLLATLQTSPTPEVIKALARFKDTRVVDALITQLPSAQAAEALWMIGDRRAIEPLIACLQAPNPVDRSQAARIVGEFGAVQAIVPLIACLQDPETDVRVAAIRALGKLGGRRGLMELVPIWIESLNSHVGSQTLPILLAAKNPQVYERMLDLLDEKDWRESKEGARPRSPLNPWRGASAEPLIECLQDQDPYVRATAARVLIKVGENHHSGYFIGMNKLREMITQDPDDQVRSTVLDVLVATKKTVVYSLLRELRDGKDQKLSQWATAALEQWNATSQQD